MGPLPLRRGSRLPCVAGYDIATPGRVPVELAKALVVNKNSPMELSWRKDSAALADCLLGIARSGLHAYDPRYAFFGIHPACVFVLNLPFWTALDAARPAATMSRMSWKTDTSRKSRSAVEKLFGLEWDGADLRGRSRFAARSGNTDKLVQYASLDVPHSVLGDSLSSVLV